MKIRVLFEIIVWSNCATNKTTLFIMLYKRTSESIILLASKFIEVLIYQISKHECIKTVYCTIAFLTYTLIFVLSFPLVIQHTMNVLV